MNEKVIDAIVKEAREKQAVRYSESDLYYLTKKLIPDFDQELSAFCANVDTLLDEIKKQEITIKRVDNNMLVFIDSRLLSVQAQEEREQWRNQTRELLKESGIADKHQDKIIDLVESGKLKNINIPFEKGAV